MLLNPFKTKGLALLVPPPVTRSIRQGRRYSLKSEGVLLGHCEILCQSPFLLSGFKAMGGEMLTLHAPFDLLSDLFLRAGFLLGFWIVLVRR